MRNVILLLILLISSFAFAQQDGIKVKVFDADEVKSEYSTKRKGILGDLNYIKINPYLLARGAFTIGYERILHPKHAVEVNAGLTYRDYIYENFEAFDSDYQSTVNVGHIIDFAYKFYPKFYNDFEGLYLSPGFLIRNYNIEKEVYYTYNETKIVDGGYSMKETYLKFGYVHESWWIDDLILDTYCGIGMRNISSMEHEIIYGVNGKSDEMVNFLKKSSVPAIYLGVKIGWSF